MHQWEATGAEVSVCLSVVCAHTPQQRQQAGLQFFIQGYFETPNEESGIAPDTAYTCRSLYLSSKALAKTNLHKSSDFRLAWASFLTGMRLQIFPFIWRANMKKSELFHLAILLCLEAFACIKFKTSKHLSPPQSNSYLVVKYEMVSAPHSHPHVYHLYFNMIFAALLTFKSCLVAHSHLPDWLMLRLLELIPTNC